MYPRYKDEASRRTQYQKKPEARENPDSVLDPRDQKRRIFTSTGRGISSISGKEDSEYELTRKGRDKTKKKSDLSDLEAEGSGNETVREDTCRRASTRKAKTGHEQGDWPKSRKDSSRTLQHPVAVGSGISTSYDTIAGQPQTPATYDSVPQQKSISAGEKILQEHLKGARSRDFLFASGLISCLEMCKSDPLVWKENRQAFAEVAVKLYEIGEDTLADQCCERIVILSSCKDKTPEKSCRWLEDILNRDRTLYSNYSSILQRLRTNLQERAARSNSPEHARNSGDLFPNPTQPIYGGQGFNNFNLQNSTFFTRPPTYGRRTSNSQQSLPTSQDLCSSAMFSQRQSGNALPSLAHELPGPDYQNGFPVVGGPQLPPLGQTSLSFSGQKHSLSGSLEEMNLRGPTYENDTASETTYDGFGRVIAEAAEAMTVNNDFSRLTIRGEDKRHDPQSEALRDLPDKLKQALRSAYRVKFGREAEEFYVIGRVFAMLWHENVGVNGGPNESRDTYNADKPFHTVLGPYRERIFSHIRRFVVIKRKRGYCWGVPIGSYSGKGLTEKNKNLDEIKAHAIIYDSSRKPVQFKGEKIDKEPIAVMIHGKQTLNDGSRVNFAKPQSIDWNIKTMDVGMVHPDSMSYLKGYFAQEVLSGTD